MFLICPSRPQVLRRDGKRRTPLHELTFRFAAERDIPVVDALPVLERLCRENDVKEAQLALLQLDQRDELLSSIQTELARDEVRAQFLARGVSPTEVDARVAALSTEELRELQLQIDELPAGGILEVIGVVFVVLLILELVGVTNIFTKV